MKQMLALLMAENEHILKNIKRVIANKIEGLNAAITEREEKVAETSSYSSSKWLHSKFC